MGVDVHLLDSNVFIFSKRDYYPIDRVPEYWGWLVYKFESGDLKMPRQVFKEICGHEDELKDWAHENEDALILDNKEFDRVVGAVLERYGQVTTSDLEYIGADPFLIAAGMVTGSTVVSKEVSSPSKKGRNRKVPDICRELGVRCINDHEMIRELDFRTNWRA